MLISLPQLLPWSRAHQCIHCTWVYSVPVFASYILHCLKYQCFYFTAFLDKNINFLSHKTVDSSLSRPASITALHGDSSGCVCHTASPTCPLAACTSRPCVSGAGIPLLHSSVSSRQDAVCTQVLSLWYLSHVWSARSCQQGLQQSLEPM